MEPLAVLAAVLAQCATVLALEDADIATVAAEARTGHRAGMIFPLLLAISRRLAALIPTALITLVAIAAMLVFAKKAFLMSAAALAVALYDSYRARRKHQKYKYQEVIEPLHFTEVHFKPYSSKPFKRPSSYDVPLHSVHAGSASYYRTPVSGYSKPFDTFSSPSQNLDVGDAPAGGYGDGGSYEVVDDYRPLGGGPAYVGDASEQQESFSPLHPNHRPQQDEIGQLDQPSPSASVLSPTGSGPGLNHRPQAQPLHGPPPFNPYLFQQRYHSSNQRLGASPSPARTREGRARSARRLEVETAATPLREAAPAPAPAAATR